MSDLSATFAHIPPFGIDTILKIIPHRYPFLLVDRITEFTENSVKGIKNLTVNEGVFQGHFPGQPVYPGVLHIETMAQVGACWILSRRENLGKVAYLMTVEEAKFRRPALPGMRLEISGVISNLKSRTGKLTANITCEGQELSSAIILFAFQKDAASGGVQQ
jgi:beta-hydroxyacyl-ACP dehydratase FabZ